MTRRFENVAGFSRYCRPLDLGWSVEGTQHRLMKRATVADRTFLTQWEVDAIRADVRRQYAAVEAARPAAPTLILNIQVNHINVAADHAADDLERWFDAGDTGRARMTY